MAGLKRRASLVFYVVDDFTGHPVPAGGAELTIKMQEQEEKKAEPASAFLQAGPDRLLIRRDDGYFIFMNLENGSYEVSITGRYFYEKKVRVDLPGNNKLCDVIPVRLVPNQHYPFPASAVCLEGYGEPNIRLQLLIRQEGKEFKLLSDYKEEKIIQLFSLEKKELDGRSFLIDDKEYFTVEQTLDREKQLYRMKEPLKGAYKKNEARIVPVMEVDTDEKGYFLALCSMFTESAISAKDTICTIKSGNQVLAELKLLPGKINTIHLQKGEF